MDPITQGVLDAFFDICSVPHGSGNEAALRARIAARLTALGYAPWQDTYGNLLCDLPASPGCAHAPRVLLQAHLDMVCTGTGGWDGTRDPVQPRIEDGWVCTGGRSSLGADCGAGLAVLLWLAAHPELPHPPLRLILTVEEETGLTGARAVPADALRDAAYLINLDGFRLGRLVTGCAGGLRERYSRAISRRPAPDTPGGTAYRLTFTGFTGGHSGFDIGAGRANAILLMGELLRETRMEVPFALAALDGGTTFNAIPYTCTAEIVTIAPAREVLEALGTRLCTRFPQEPDGKLIVEEIAPPSRVLDGGAASGLLTVLGGFADGVHTRHASGAVADSSNLGHVYVRDDVLYVDAMLRCMHAEAEQGLHQSHQLVAGMCGFACTVHSRYPAWPEEQDSLLSGLLADSLRARTGQQAEITVQHVGLEPALLREKHPQLRCICIGMELQDCHSPRERWRVDSIAPFAGMLTDTLAALSKRNAP